MIVLGLDFETTWDNPVDTSKALITEIGAVLWDTTENKPLEIYNTLVYSDQYPESPEELVELTGITDDMLKKYGRNRKESFSQLHTLMDMAEAIVAHNGNSFDKPIWDAEYQREFGEDPIQCHWIDTRIDVPYPKNIVTRKLTHLCAEHGFVNTFSHRAIFDVLSMLKVMSMYNLEDVLKLSKEPNVFVYANVSFQKKDLAKERGYRWNPDHKVWFLECKQSVADREELEAPFKVNIERK